jgi:hypothetical protein
MFRFTLKRSHFVLAAVMAGFLGAGAERAEAIPVLQLDIVDGWYDPVSRTVMTSDFQFTLVAVLTPKAGATPETLAALLNDRYYVAAALVPKTGPAHSDLGSFSIDGTSISATNDMTYGTPPYEVVASQLYDAGDLNEEGIYNTFYYELPFQFSPLQRAQRYDSSLTPGGLTVDSAGPAYFATMNVDLTGLTDPNVAMHFDLYSSFVSDCLVRKCTIGDNDIEYFAPHTNDAQSLPARSAAVPEPSTLALLVLGFGAAARRRFARQQ